MQILCRGSCVARGYLLITLLAHFQPCVSLNDEDSKSLWHQMAQALQLVRADDRDKFLDLCVRQNTKCEESNFNGDTPEFYWDSGEVSAKAKERFWHSYECTFARDISLCPIDGGWSGWSHWGECNSACEEPGSQIRTRTCTNPTPVKGGAFCHGSVLRSRPCHGACIEAQTNDDGEEEAKGYLEAVHQTYPQLKRDCFLAHCTFADVQRIVADAKTSDKYWSTLSCVKYKGACPVDGQWGKWSLWSECSVKCGRGTRSRRRSCDDPIPQYGGRVCNGAWSEHQHCVQMECGFEVPETFTDWTEWSACSVPCGAYGVQFATQVCLHKGGCRVDGVLTPFINSSRPCYLGPCSNPGGWSDWTQWTPCSARCGTGRQSRLRLCNSPFATGGLSCPGQPLDFRLCEGSECDPALPCIDSPECSVETERTIVRTGEQVTSTKESTDITSGQFIELNDVKSGRLESLDSLGHNDEYLSGPLNPEAEGLFWPWNGWSSCSLSCSGGTRVRTRQCAPQVPFTNPQKCQGETRQVQFCNIHVCPVHGGWGDWLPWTPCSVTCGNGKRRRYRECNSPLPKFGGFCAGDSTRTEGCDMPTCPDGPFWSPWSQWSLCSVTCGGGVRARDRTYRRSAPYTQGFSSEVANPDKMEERVDCSNQPCPEDGDWAEWGEWSKCSTACGMGYRVRDRTCTDPAPALGGATCPGVGTDVGHCYGGPCRDGEDTAITLQPTSWIHYPAQNRPERYLAMYLHFKPLSDGMIIRRFRKCHNNFDDNDTVDQGDKREVKSEKKMDDDDKCRLVVELSLSGGMPLLSVHARDASLQVLSNVSLAVQAMTLLHTTHVAGRGEVRLGISNIHTRLSCGQMGKWHELLVEVFRSGASVRVNNRERLSGQFSKTLFRDLDFDSDMRIGYVDEKIIGFQGSIVTLSVNFRILDLLASTDLQAEGNIITRHGITSENINPIVLLPHLHGVYYLSLRLPPPKGDELTVTVTVSLDEPDGLLLYMAGQAEDSFLSLGVRHSKLALCVQCGPKPVCHLTTEQLKLHQWYHVAVVIDKKKAELRVDEGKAAQFSCADIPYMPKHYIYIGGRDASHWPMVQRATNYTKGFFGAIGSLVMNDVSVSFRHAVLLGRDGRINPEGYRKASRITPVYEHKASIVNLRCEVAPSQVPDEKVQVLWLYSDSVLKPSSLVEINEPVGEGIQIATLIMKPGGHPVGLYACLISRDGRLALTHVYPLFRHTVASETYEDSVEWMGMGLLAVLLPLVALLLFGYQYSDRIVNFFRTWSWRQNVPLLLSGDKAMELVVPKKTWEHPPDTETSITQRLASDDYETTKVQIVKSDESEPRLLSITPGVATRRSTVTRPSLELGQNLRPTYSRDLQTEVHYEDANSAIISKYHYISTPQPEPIYQEASTFISTPQPEPVYKETSTFLSTPQPEPVYQGTSTFISSPHLDPVYQGTSKFNLSSQPEPVYQGTSKFTSSFQPEPVYQGTSNFTSCSQPEPVYQGTSKFTSSFQPEPVYQGTSKLNLSSQPEPVYQGTSKFTSSFQPEPVYQGTSNFTSCSQPEPVYQGTSNFDSSFQPEPVYQGTSKFTSSFQPEPVYQGTSRFISTQQSEPVYQETSRFISTQQSEPVYQETTTYVRYAGTGAYNSNQSRPPETKRRRLSSMLVNSISGLPSTDFAGSAQPSGYVSRGSDWHACCHQLDRHHVIDDNQNYNQEQQRAEDTEEDREDDDKEEEEEEENDDEDDDGKLQQQQCEPERFDADGKFRTDRRRKAAERPGRPQAQDRLLSRSGPAWDRIGQTQQLQQTAKQQENTKGRDSLASKLSSALEHLAQTQKQQQQRKRQPHHRQEQQRRQQQKHH